MFECRICKWSVERDDVAIMLSEGRCVCLLCYERETQTEKRLPAQVRRDAQQAADGA